VKKGLSEWFRKRFSSAEVFCEVVGIHQGGLALPHLGFNKKICIYVKKK